MEKLLIVNAGENLEDKVLRVNKRTSLTLKPGPRCMALGVRIKTNYPLKKGAKFARSQYHELTIESDHQDQISSCFNWHAKLDLDLAGTFHFLCESTDTSGANVEPIWSAYVTVDPELRVASLEAIKCQTVLSKNLGPLNEWRRRLQVSHDAHYNMIHFTPIQELGQSNSAYSIRNQLKVAPSFNASLNDIKKEVEYMEKKWNMLSITDIVLNHTADDSEWIYQHPECAYNCHNSPHLRPAFLLDCAFIWLGKDLMSGQLKHTDGLGDTIRDERDVHHIGILLRNFYVAFLKIHELFTINIGQAIADYSKLFKTASDRLEIDYAQYERNCAIVRAIPENVKTPEGLRTLLEQENARKRQEVRDWLNYAVENALNAIRYERLNPKGPYFQRPISASEPLVAPYFTHTPYDQFKVAHEEKLMFTSGAHFMAHNGWVMGLPSTDDFAAPTSQVYLKRELVAWGDCVKLNYGQKPTDAPYLWDYMRKYVESQAKVFHGFRIDNCHSTPLHVAEYVVDVARAKRPDIYIMAELFTSNESSDNIYVNKLGLTTLIRESMNAHDSRELGRLVYRFGGQPVGAFAQYGAQMLKPGVAHAIFYDQTHDNDSPVATRSAYDLPATTAIINMAACATGSTRGYDELVPHHINVVTESRLYPLDVPESCGMLPLRRVLNGLLQQKLSQGFSEIFVDQRNDDVIAITRHNPVDGRSVVLVARTAFSKTERPCPLAPLSIQGKCTSILFEAQAYGSPHKYERSDEFINGLSSFKTKIFSQNTPANECKLATIRHLDDADMCEISMNEFQFLPSSVLCVEIALSDRQSSALRQLNEWQVDLHKFGLTLNDANFLLFRCAEEDAFEPYALPGFCKFAYAGLYGLIYHLNQVRENQDQAHPLTVNLRAGNWLSEYLVTRMKRRTGLLHLAQHLDDALKLVDLLPRGMVPKYFDLIITNLYNAILELVYAHMSLFVSKGPSLVKLLAVSSVALVGECESAPLPSLDNGMSQYNNKSSAAKLPYLPSIAAGLPHFAAGYMRNWGRDTFIALRGLLLITGRHLEARSIILSYARTLHHGLIPNLLDGGTKSRYNCRDAVWWWLYSVREYTRLVPNGAEILGSMIKRIHKPEGGAINALPQRKRSTAQMSNGTSNCSSSSSSALTSKQETKREAAQNDGLNHVATSVTQQLCDIIQEAIECHFKGMEFREENAGKMLDEHMKDEGFNIKIGIDRDTGFVYGGNRWNCGTWMDKMGSSEKAGTKGLPASPRDGYAVEIIGLSKAVLSWLEDMYKNRMYPYDGVECLYDNTITLKWTWKRWAALIQNNFEKHFYIPLESEVADLADTSVTHKAELINRRGIYKDTVGASLEWQDYQLRPNFVIAMVVAPELFDTKHAQNALHLVKRHLVGPLGVKTLDPSDWNYVGDYDNSNDSEDPKVAHGFNYHQGPEWLWLTGYYIRASSKFVGASERPYHMQLLSNFYAALVDSPWLGLPELTNANGKPCPHSCHIQAWSVGTAIEALHESARTI